MRANKVIQARRFLLPAVIALSVVGCTAEASIETLEPTFTLIPATATFTPSPIPPTPTPEATDAPGVTIEIEPTAVDTPVPSYAPLEEVDPVAAELAFIAQGLVADQTGLPTRRIRVVSVEALLWRDTSLGCPVPGQASTPNETLGYRIVIQAGDTEYLFHTDVDRVIPCDPENEILPDVLPEITPEVTESGS